MDNSMTFKYPEELEKAVEYGFIYYNPKGLTKDQIRENIIQVAKVREENGHSYLIHYLYVY